MSETAVRDLYRELRSCQRRLGTSAEQPDDFERVLRLAHQLNNHLAAAYLRRVAETGDESSQSLAAICKECLDGSGA